MSELEPWRVVSSAVLIEDRWLRLRAEVCETALGERIEPYYIVDSRDWSAVVAITTQDEIVLVRQYRHGLGKIVLELPGGEIKADEDAVACGMRELMEEAGFGGGSAELVCVLAPNPTRCSNQMSVVLAHGVTPSTRPPQEIGEETETVLWPLSRASELLFEPTFCNAPLLAAVAIALVRLGQLGPPLA